MEDFLILVFILLISYGYNALKHFIAKKTAPKQKPPQRTEEAEEYYSEDYEPKEKTPKALRDLIRQFEDAQREATTSGSAPMPENYEEDYDESYDEEFDETFEDEKVPEYIPPVQQNAFDLKRAEEILRNREKMATANTVEEQTAIAKKKFIAHHKNIEEVRRGFIWAKIIDEPRFKKQWTRRSR